jgi:hypothetical protein
MPSYRYVDEQGKPFAGTFLGGGSYGGFGGATQTNQRGWSNYTGDRPIAGRNYENSPVWGRNGTGIPERSGPRNPEYGSNPEKIAKAKEEEMKREQKDFSPFDGQDIRSLTGFGGIPIFPNQAYF